MQEEILNKDTNDDLQVYAVWFEMYPGDEPERWPADALPDERVVHYWDEGKAVGEWYGKRLDEMKAQLAAGSTGVEPPVLWDAYLVYGPESRWSDAPNALRRWGRTVLVAREDLRKAVQELTASGQ